MLVQISKFIVSEKLILISVKIVDLDKPKVRIETQNRYPLTVNSTATFRCIVQGNPQPEFR